MRFSHLVGDRCGREQGPARNRHCSVTGAVQDRRAGTGRLWAQTGDTYAFVQSGNLQN